MTNFGDVPTWIAAIGTVGALAGSLVLIRGQLGEWTQAAEDRRRGQAENVSAWVWRFDALAEPHPLLILRVTNSNSSAI